MRRVRRSQVGWGWAFDGKSMGNCIREVWIESCEGGGRRSGFGSIERAATARLRAYRLRENNVKTDCPAPGGGSVSS